MDITFENIIDYLVNKIPELEKSPGFQEDDRETPYVAFACFLPFIRSKDKILKQFIFELSKISQEKKFDTRNEGLILELFMDALNYQYEDKIIKFSEGVFERSWEEFIINWKTEREK